MAKKEMQHPPAPLKYKRTEITLFTSAEFAYDPHTKLHHGRIHALQLASQSRTLLGCKQALSGLASSALAKLAQQKGPS